ncbi:hypothetical protein QQ045_012202 [Rhodiola kirilowii]
MGLKDALKKKKKRKEASTVGCIEEEEEKEGSFDSLQVFQILDYGVMDNSARIGQISAIINSYLLMRGQLPQKVARHGCMTFLISSQQGMKTPEVPSVIP